jgi:hypothetical protein
MGEQHELIIHKSDWSDLPSDIVRLIAKKLLHLLDFIHVHLTCKSWHSVTPLSDFPLHFPWLLQFHQTSNDLISIPTTRLCLHSIFSGETLTIPIKESRWFRGSSNNYLPFVNDQIGTISLLNPLTNDEYVVPLVPDRCKSFSTLMVETEPGPIRDRRMIITDQGEIGRADRWAIYDPQHRRWSQHEGLGIETCYCQGKFFDTLFEGSKTLVIDASSGNLLYEILPQGDETTNGRPPEEMPYYLVLFKSYVVDSGGETLRVFWYIVPESNSHKSEFQICRLSFEGIDGQPCWVKINDIGNQILFLEVIGCTVAANGYLVTAAPSIGLRGGRIYFIDPSTGKPYVYNIASGTAEKVPCPFDKCTWFVPGLI